MPEWHRVAGNPAFSASARTVHRGPGPTPGMAVRVRRRLSASPRLFHHPAVRSLCSLWRVRHTGFNGDDPALQRDAIVSLDGLRSCDEQYAHVARQPLATLVSSECEAHRRNRGLAVAGLRFYRHRMALGDRAATHRL